MPADPRRPSPPDGRRGRIAALAVVVVLVVALALIGQAIVRHNALQNCLDSGRRDCDTRVP